MNPIIEPFNLTYLICWGIAIIAMVAIGLGFKGKSEKSKKVFLVGLCGFTLIVYTVYKAILVGNADYAAALLREEQITDYGWFYELPLQLCNINMFLIPIGVLTGKRGLLGFSFFLAPLGAAMALFFPSTGFAGEPLFTPHILGFFLTHYLIVISGISIATLGFFRPKFKDFPNIFITLVALSAMIHIVNLILINTGLCEKANYFFTMNPGGVSLLQLFARITTIPFLYMLPSLVIMGVYMSLITAGFAIAGRSKGKDETIKEKSAQKEKETVEV